MFVSLSWTLLLQLYLSLLELEEELASLYFLQPREGVESRAEA